jgi:hypothetical protein
MNSHLSPLTFLLNPGFKSHLWLISAIFHHHLIKTFNKILISALNPGFYLIQDLLTSGFKITSLSVFQNACPEVAFFNQCLASCSIFDQI